MQICDELGTIYKNPALAELFPELGEPAEFPWRLVLVTIWKFAEGP